MSSQLIQCLLENRQLRATERQLLAFMLRFLLGYYSRQDARRHLENKLSSDDLDLLYANCFRGSRRKKLRSLIVVFYLYGIPKPLIADGLCVYGKTVKKYIRKYIRAGLGAIFPPRKGIKKADDPEYQQAIFTILHSPPKEHGFNRTTWRIQDLITTMTRIGKPIGKNKVSTIIKKAGYRFRKAREVLTSNDPNYREKLDNIKRILSNLKETERFFSIR